MTINQNDLEATAWYDGFLDALNALESNPFQGSIAAENDLFDFELREIHYGSGKRLTHRALYRVVGKYNAKPTLFTVVSSHNSSGFAA